MTTALITGANKGIGYEIARLLGQEGVTVLVGARDTARGEAAAERLGARFVQIDVTSPESVVAAAKQIGDEYGALDILVNNAGVALGAEPPSGTTVEVTRAVYETNVFGVIEVTNAMLPLLRRAPAARIVNVSSEVGSLTAAGDPDNSFYALNMMAYQSSKAALNMITVCYAKEFRETPIKINACDPGYCATDMNDHQGPRSAEEGARTAVRLSLLGADGPTGAFVGGEGSLPW
ncbi:SDR family oxidoreductase [Microtetraspora sp. NBRC 16547]|uniref:SDR family oxidoreductase n=1 Tax=Microtetraspora sp. NBRC 16547 TaxID=3030993 RepID=UPI0024A2E74C|nr:SDR family oxidoreductase [Microtetraspora sp. NBRC 16547]GLX01621.1 short-chain dehydrogenase [Microtetraspora sp. NBRC 16547]